MARRATLGRDGGSGEDGGARLTAREREVFRLLARGATPKEVGSLLSITELTVRTHIRNVTRRLGVSGMRQALLTLM